MGGARPPQQQQQQQHQQQQQPGLRGPTPDWERSRAGEYAGHGGPPSLHDGTDGRGAAGGGPGAKPRRGPKSKDELESAPAPPSPAPSAAGKKGKATGSRASSPWSAKGGAAAKNGKNGPGSVTGGAKKGAGASTPLRSRDDHIGSRPGSPPGGARAQRDISPASSDGSNEPLAARGPSSRMVDEDYDEGAADALMGLAGAASASASAGLALLPLHLHRQRLHPLQCSRIVPAARRSVQRAPWASDHLLRRKASVAMGPRIRTNEQRTVLLAQAQQARLVRFLELAPTVSRVLPSLSLLQLLDLNAQSERARTVPLVAGIPHRQQLSAAHLLPSPPHQRPTVVWRRPQHSQWTSTHERHLSQPSLLLLLLLLPLLPLLLLRRKSTLQQIPPPSQRLRLFPLHRRQHRRHRHPQQLHPRLRLLRLQSRMTIAGKTKRVRFTRIPLMPHLLLLLLQPKRMVSDISIQGLLSLVTVLSHSCTIKIYSGHCWALPTYLRWCLRTIVVSRVLNCMSYD